MGRGPGSECDPAGGAEGWRALFADDLATLRTVNERQSRHYANVQLRDL
ncbi:hypothetical protein [Streptomyces sp. UNOC14_S4]|nr:hypothetical protein [Streptomyces sp. UNOC14_S4]MCC3769125.1 hypothetical protein [Streptomyces sp. UNOC14_S4]